MIVQIKFTVTGNDSDDIRKAAETTLMDFVGTDAVDGYRMVVEVHDSQPERTAHAVGDRALWMGHVTARMKRKRSADYDDDFGW